MSELNITTFYVLDLDRTLLDTEKAADVLRVVVAAHNPQLAIELAKNVEDYSLHDKSFSMRDFILGQIGEPETAEIEAARHKARLTGHVHNAQVMLLAAGLAAFSIVGVATAMLTTIL